jgi:aminoglycoside phosphotransferase (APT) family kinase protein
MMTNEADFRIEDFDSTRAGLLGEGLWGHVYDLCDGTVLKVARENCAGIGSGREKSETEYRALTALAGTDLVPAAFGRGAIPREHALAAEGFGLWLRMAKKPGAQIYVSAFAELTPGRRDEIGDNIGRALARLHAAMTPVFKDDAPDADHYAEIRAETGDDPFYRAALAALEAGRRAVPVSVLRPVHNDFNISNLLFKGTTVSGILDFAECGVNFPEKDISDIIKEVPILETPFVNAYEKESGFRTDRRRILLGLAENALYGAVIAARLGDKAGAATDWRELVRHLQALGHK